MRGMETGKTRIRHEVFTEIARMAYEGGDYAQRLEELPTFEECGDFEQIENGVGLFRRFEHDFMNALEDLPTAPRMREFDSVSGVSIAPHMSRLFKKLLLPPYGRAPPESAHPADAFAALQP